MSHAQGRFGQRDNRGHRNGHANASSSGQHPRHSKQPSHLQQAVTPKDFAAVATALMTRNFQRLIEVAGPANLAIALDLTEKRIADIAAGNFTVETAHHIEQTLGLPGNFMEQVNPEVTEAVVMRLKSPFESKNTETDDEPESSYEPVQPTPAVRAAAPVQLHLVPNIAAPDAASPQVDEQVTEQPQESEMAKAAPRNVPAKKAAKKQPAAKKATQQSFLPSESDVEEIRRDNLKLLTARLGSKGIVCVLTGMTPANLSHRLAGLKRFDDETANLFTKALHLPENWISTPHQSENDIPKKVYEILDPQGVNKGMKPEKKAAAEKPAAAKKAPASKTAAAKKVAVKSAAPRERVLAPADVSAPRLSAGVLGRKSTTATAPAAATRTAAAPAATRAAPPAAAEPAQHQPAAAAAVADAPARASAPSAAPVATFEPEDLQDLHPITVALIKTLVMKAREDRIDVPTAINLLTEVSKL